MSTTAPLAVDSAEKYQEVFNRINTSYWAGSSHAVPVVTPDGRRLWFTGRSFTGVLAADGTRASPSSNVYSAILSERGGLVTPYVHGAIDIVNNRRFAFNSYPIFGTNPYGRIEPVSALTLGYQLFLMVRASTTDWTSWQMTTEQPYYLLEVSLSNLHEGSLPLGYAYPLPVHVDIFYGCEIMSFHDDGFLYFFGARFANPTYSLYVCRTPLRLLARSLPDVEYYTNENGGYWTRDMTKSSPWMTGLGSLPSIWREDGQIYVMYLSLDQTDILLRKTSFLLNPSILAPEAVATVQAEPGAVGFKASHPRVVQGVQLASGNKLGLYGVDQTDPAYDNANPDFRRPRFFEFSLV